MLSSTPSSPVRLAAAIAVLACAGAAQAAVEPLVMQMSAVSSSCINNCVGTGNDTIDTDTPEPLYGSFGNFVVNTFTSPGTNAFTTEAWGSTILTSDTSFIVHQYVNRPIRPADSTGDYNTTVETNFAFITGAEGGQLSVDYVVHFQRPLPGHWLHTGLGISAPGNLGGYSPVAQDYYSLSGVVAGTWVVDLLPNTYYDMTLATSNVTSFSAGPNAPFEQDSMDVTYTVSMPSFAVPVPEPTSWALWLVGLATIGRLGRRSGRRIQAVD